MPVTFIHSAGCVSAKVLTLSEDHWVKNPKGTLSHYIAKLTNGPITQKHGVGYHMKFFYLCGQRLTCVLILEKKRFTSITEKAQRDQTALNKEGRYWLMIAAQASHLLYHSHFCQPWHKTTAHCWEPGRKSMLPFFLILLILCSWFLIHIFVGNVLLVDFKEHLLSERVTPSLSLSSLSN